MKKNKKVLLSIMLVIAVFMSACSTEQTEKTKKSKKTDKSVEEVQTETKATSEAPVVESVETTETITSTEAATETTAEPTTEATTTTEETSEATTTTEATTETTAVSEETTTEAPQSDCSIIFDITYNENIAMAKYTVVLYLDDAKIDSIDHGKYYLQKVGTTTGDHVIRFEKRGDSSCATTVKINITGDSTLFFELTSHLDEIEIRNSRKIDGLEDMEVEMPNVTEVRLDRARDILEAAGFKNITVESAKVIIIESNWVVIQQNIPAGERANRSTEIVIFCEKDG